MQVDFHQNIKILKRWMREIKAVFFFTLEINQSLQTFSTSVCNFLFSSSRMPMVLSLFLLNSSMAS